MTQRFLYLFSILYLCSCNTLMESADPYESFKPRYEATKNSKDETVYVRETPISNHVSQPILYPVQPIAPVYPPPSWQAPPPPETSLPRYKPAGSDGTLAIDQTEPKASSGHNFLEAAGTKGNVHLGIHFGGMVDDYFMGRLGGSMFVSEDLYLGLDLSARGYIPVKSVKPFAGLGVYYGDTKKCQQGYTDSTGRYVERCEKKFLGAGYVELGFEVENVSLFWRDYSITRAGLSVPTNGFWGIGIRF